MLGMRTTSGSEFDRRSDIDRSECVDLLADIVVSRTPRIVGIDGPDCSGKTSLCSDLRACLLHKGVVARSFAVDDLLEPRAYRHRRGEWSVDGFLEDFFDYKLLIDGLLRPLTSAGRVRFWYSPMNATSGVRGERRCCAVDPGEVLLVEGLFLLTPDRRDYFDLKVRLECREVTVLDRALERDAGRLGDTTWVLRHYQAQCLPAQRRYRRFAQPRKVADVVLALDNPRRPRVLVGPTPTS
jgi:uridine kinase